MKRPRDEEENEERIFRPAYSLRFLHFLPATSPVIFPLSFSFLSWFLFFGFVFRAEVKAEVYMCVLRARACVQFILRLLVCAISRGLFFPGKRFIIFPFRRAYCCGKYSAAPCAFNFEDRGMSVFGRRSFLQHFRWKLLRKFYK